MKALTDVLGDIEEEFPEAIAGKSSGGGGFDGPPLPENIEYRATVSRAEWRQANTSGNWSYSITFEVTEPEEWAGRKFSEYYPIDGNAIGREKFAKLIGESGINLKEVDKSSHEAFADAFVGAEFVIATRTWGTENDRSGIRYLNKDRGQALKTNVPPPKKRNQTGKPLTADIQIPKKDQEEPTVDAIPSADEAPVVSLPGGGTRPPVSLPPGLRKS